METTVTLKVEIVDGEKLTVGALNWVKFHLTNEFVQILNDTVPGEVLVRGVTQGSKTWKLDNQVGDTIIKYKISPLLKNRTIVDFLR